MLNSISLNYVSTYNLRAKRDGKWSLLHSDILPSTETTRPYHFQMQFRTLLLPVILGVLSVIHSVPLVKENTLGANAFLTPCPAVYHQPEIIQSFAQPDGSNLPDAGLSYYPALLYVPPQFEQNRFNYTCNIITDRWGLILAGIQNLVNQFIGEDGRFMYLILETGTGLATTMVNL